MGNGDVFNEDAPVFAKVPEMIAGKRGSEVSDDTVREAKTMDNVFKELDCLLCSSRTSGLYSIHLENLSMATYMYRKSPSVGLKGLIMLSPQHAKCQEARMVCNSCAGTCICLAKN